MGLSTGYAPGAGSVSFKQKNRAGPGAVFRYQRKKPGTGATLPAVHRKRAFPPRGRRCLARGKQDRRRSRFRAFAGSCFLPVSCHLPRMHAGCHPHAIQRESGTSHLLYIILLEAKLFVQPKGIFSEKQTNSCLQNCGQSQVF